ncbi:AP endonuclease [Mycobacterium sp. MS1601]|uniref:sugar phosphate isomerase/epimerase family protein n=1 Tax=Mycobacterium sp. MS1601 TaxID=1936029 RepID=UPI0009792C31|nr:sugar phosphate isomerase/epimerase [Mycobacterium sp. MS1601]AQA05685.1 AP endonuclease [Mycobacterium sp. MS1601]
MTDAKQGGDGRSLSLAPLTVLELGPDELVDVAAAAGFDAVGLRLIRATPEEPLRPSIGRTPLVRDIKLRLDDSGLRLIDIEVLRLRPDTHVRDDYGAFLETGAFLGAEQVLVTGNDPDHARTAERFAELAELAADYGMAPNLEPMPWTEVKNLQEAVSIVARAGHDNVGLLVDAIHWDRALNTPAQLSALPRNWIRYAQICDAVAERPTTVEEMIYQGRVARLLPGQGSIDLVSMLRALPADIPISVEAPVLWDAPAAVRAKAAQRAARAVLELADGDEDRRSMRYA